jgi:NAD(P)-dependent dehydrogenase (short-subunit alcohol dehydrogenase family)
VAKSADIVRLFAETKKAFGKVDVLVNNAGVYQFAPLEMVKEEEIDREYKTNVAGLILTIQEALKYCFPTTGGGVFTSCDDISSPSNDLCDSAFGKREELINPPLVVGVFAVLHRVDPPGWSDQEVRRQA